MKPDLEGKFVAENRKLQSNVLFLPLLILSNAAAAYSMEFFFFLLLKE